MNPLKNEGELIDARFFKRTSNKELFRIQSYDIIDMIDL